MAKRTYRGADEWRAIVDAQQNSGLSARTFCDENDLGYASFINWRRRLTDGSGGDHQAVVPAASFIELTAADGVVPPAAASMASFTPSSLDLRTAPVTIELSLGHGVELRITRTG